MKQTVWKCLKGMMVVGSLAVVFMVGNSAVGVPGTGDGGNGGTAEQPLSSEQLAACKDPVLKAQLPDVVARKCPGVAAAPDEQN